MTSWLVASFGLALIAGAATTILIASWPRRVTAEEWILRRRQASIPDARKGRAGWLLPVRLPRRWAEQAGYREAAQEVERDLRLAQLARFAALPSSPEQLVERLAKAGVTGAVIGLLFAIFLWRAGITENPGAAGVFLTLLGGLAATGEAYRRVRTTASRLRRSIIRRLPRIVTGARMVMESGAATPEAALALTVTLYADPAAELLREAIRIKEVHRLSLEDALDQVGTHYGIAPFGQLADAFRIGRRYGTRLSEILASFAQELRREWQASYRERITRAPVLMTVPALIFFVGPLLVLILFLVFTPLFTVLRQL
jgi:hypothetical protein